MRHDRIDTTLLAAAFGLALGMTRPALAAESTTMPEPQRIGVGNAMLESLAGDVYAEPSTWRPLSFGTFFTEGWDEAWASPPAGEGGAPRQGWLNTFDGVFYRLVIGTYGYAHDFGGAGDQHSGTVTLYAPLNRRFELRADLLFVSNNDEFAAGDDVFWTRFLLSESQNFTQSFNVGFRTPTGDADMGNGVAAIIPQYEYWSNPWRKLVARGGVAAVAPFGHQSIREVNARTLFLGDLGVGYYFTPHDLTPIGDLVWHVTTNLSQAMDDRGPNTTTLTFTPGFRTHMGRNWYLLGGVEVPATRPEPFVYQILAGLMKVF